MDFATAAVAAMMALWAREGGIGQQDARWEPKEFEVSYLTQTFIAAAQESVLIDPRTDALLLAAICYYESRLSIRPPDGDPLHLARGDVGTVVGPMQVSKAAPIWVRNMPQLQTKWSGLTVERMREPSVNVTLARDILEYWRDTCGGPPGVWITAYGWGRCPPKRGAKRERLVDWEGKRRCRTLRRLMDSVASQEVGYEVPLGFTCTGAD